MLSKPAKLNQKLFDENVLQEPTRDGYGRGVVYAAKRDPNVVVLSADLTESTRVEEFKKRFPERFIEVGVAEQNMATIAAGLGTQGKVPFISSYATFSPGRNWEQIRTTVSYNDSNVKIAGHHAGISVGPDGATHQAIEDIATMRVMANMTVIVPCDSVEAEKATEAAAVVWGPVYLRFAREKSPILTTPETPFAPGAAYVMWEPPLRQGSAGQADALIIGCGPLLYQALLAAKELEEKKINVIVLNCHTVKPLDGKTVVDLVKRAGAVVTVEEHQVSGGLGGAVAELLAREAPAPMEFVGMQNVFGESGTPAELVRKYGMDAKAIIAAVRRVIRRK